MNIIRQSHEQQLTAITLIYTVYAIITTIPFLSIYIYILSTTVTSLEQRYVNLLIYVVSILINYSIVAINFKLLFRLF